MMLHQVTGSNPSQSIRIVEEALPDRLFERLARSVRELGRERLKSTYTTNFWFPSGAAPGNVAEEAVLELSRIAGAGSEIIGMEWWLGRLRPGQKLRFHFDRDIALKKQTGEYVHPVLGSALYLNSFPSSPTVILDQVLAPDGMSRIPEKPGWRKSIPAVSNRYVMFPGNLRHGVIPDENAELNGETAGAKGNGPALRLTLLVNYWTRRPLPPVCRDYDGSIYAGLKNADV